MGLSRSATGVAYSVGVEQMYAAEMELYADRLVESWAHDQRKLAWAMSHGWREQPRRLLTLVALTMYEEAWRSAAGNRGLERMTARDMAHIDATAYKRTARAERACWIAAAEAVTARALRPESDPVPVQRPRSIDLTTATYDAVP